MAKAAISSAPRERETPGTERKAVGSSARVTTSAPGPMALQAAIQLPPPPGSASPRDSYFAARRGLRDAKDPLPFRQEIQAAFGEAHDLSGVRAGLGGAADDATRRLGTSGFTEGERVALRGTPDLRTVAHEAAHVIQQRAGLLSTGAVGRPGDQLERDADAVAAQVVAGQSARTLLPTHRTSTPIGGLQFADPRAAEAERAVGEMWGVVNGINAPGAELEFLYFTSQGAMTLVEIKRAQPGAGSVGSASLDDFKNTTFDFKGGLATGSTLVTFVGTSERYVRIVLRRTAAGWSLQRFGEESPSDHPSMPAEGRTIPNAAGTGWPVEVFTRVVDRVSKIVPLLGVYPGGTATFRFAVEYDDDRVESLTLGGGTYTGGKGPTFTPAGSGISTVLTNTILAFSQGLGRRRIAFSLDGSASGAASAAIWRVSDARVDRGPAPKLPDEAEAIVSDYYRMHAEIIAKWREGVKDAGVYAAMFGAEQLAFWLIGGVITKGLGLVFETAAPRLIQFIRLGSKGRSREGVAYLETMVARLGPAERAEMQGLARKAETEGVESLGKAERERLGQLLKKLEELIDKPLTQVEKDTLRGRMVARFKGAKPAVDAAFQAANRGYQIHHRLPLEYAHHFPGVDVNAGRNLIAMETEVHRGVNAIWTRLRTSTPAGKVNGNVVSRTADFIDKQFGRWYDKVPGGSGSGLTAEIDMAKSACLMEVDALVKTLL